MCRPTQKGIKVFLLGICIPLAVFSAVSCDHAIAIEEDLSSDVDTVYIDDNGNAIDQELVDNSGSDTAKEQTVIKDSGKISDKKAAVVKENTKIADKQVAVKENTKIADKQIVIKDGGNAANRQIIGRDNSKAAGEKASSKTVVSANNERLVSKISKDVGNQQIVANKNKTGDLTDDKQPVGEDIEFVKGIEAPVQVKPLVEPVLKKMDVTKIGSSPYYETYEGLRLLKYFTVAQRVEIYQEARPIDSYIMDAHSMRILYNNTPWDIKSDYRTQLTPVFTRAYGTEVTMSNPKNKEGQIRYTHDYREIYRNYYPKWPQIKREMWDQNEVLFMHSKQIDPISWNYTSNLGYRYSTLSDKEAPANVFNSYYNIRQTYFGSLSLAPTDKLEWFGQAEYYKSKYVKCSWAYSPDHFLGRTELRIKSNDMKTMYVPSFSYSKDFYYPYANTYQKYEIQFRVGRDFTKRFSATSTVKYAMGLRDEPDNTAPLYNETLFGKNPFKDKAYTLALENRFSYNVYDRLYLQAGLDIATGLNWSIFDNFAMLAGLEYYAPGMIRVDFGWTGNYYYNLQDFLSSIYFKCYFFM